MGTIIILYILLLNIRFNNLNWTNYVAHKFFQLDRIIFLETPLKIDIWLISFHFCCLFIISICFRTMIINDSLWSQTLFTVPWKLLKRGVQKLFVSGSFYLFWELFSARASLVDLSLTRLELESSTWVPLAWFSKWERVSLNFLDGLKVMRSRINLIDCEEGAAFQQNNFDRIRMCRWSNGGMQKLSKHGCSITPVDRFHFICGRGGLATPFAVEWMDRIPAKQVPRFPWSTDAEKRGQWSDHSKILSIETTKSRVYTKIRSTYKSPIRLLRENLEENRIVRFVKWQSKYFKYFKYLIELSTETFKFQT